MSDVRVTQRHQMGVAGAKKAIEPFLSEYLPKYGMSLTWKGNQAELKGTGASGSLSVTETEVTVVIKLGMMARVAGVKPDKVQESIEKRLSSALAPA